MKFAEQTGINPDWQNPNLDDTNWSSASVSFGAQFLKLGPLPSTVDFEALETKLSKITAIDIQQPVEINGQTYFWKPYEFSWRWGLKGDAGHQGYHGLKGEVNNEIISFGRREVVRLSAPVYPLFKEAEGSIYYLWSTVTAPKSMKAKINRGGLLPVKVCINQADRISTDETVDLNAGDNSILLKYDQVGRGYYVLEESNPASEWKQTIQLATNWYLNPSVLTYNCFPQKNGTFGWYRFMSPPGARTLYLTTKAKPTVWISGVEISIEPTTTQSFKMADKTQPVWKASIPDSIVKSSQVVVKMEQLPGFFGGAAVPEPFTFDCGKGEIAIGDLDKNESLRTYSGGMWYRKNLTLTAEQLTAKSIILNLGDVVASANVYVNGQLIGQKATSPWTFDLTSKLKTGENRIEILVYNTLGNHYLTTPSQYVGRTKSGLIGPVELIILKK